MPAPNNTIYALTEEARRLPDNSLITNLQNHSGSIPSWVLLGEVERRKALRDGATASKEPEGTVAKDAIAGLQAIAQQSPPAPQPQPQAPQGPMQPQMPTASMAAGGGIRSLAEGGGIEDELQAGDEAAAFYASQAEQEDGDGPDDEGDGDIDEPDYGAEDDYEDDAQPEDDSEEPIYDDSEDDVGSYARGGRVKKRVKRFNTGGDIDAAGGRDFDAGADQANGPGGASLGTDGVDANVSSRSLADIISGANKSADLNDTLSGASPAANSMGASLMSAISNVGTGLSNFGSGIASLARDPSGTYNDFMGQPHDPYSTGDATNAPGGGMQPSYLDYIQAPPPPMPIMKASGGSIDTRLLRPASGPPVPLLHPLNIEGANGNQTAQNPQDYADKVKQLRLQAAMDGRQNSMRRNDPRYAHGIAGQMRLDPKDVADRLRTDSMKKGGVVKMADGRGVVDTTSGNPYTADDALMRRLNAPVDGSTALIPSFGEQPTNPLLSPQFKIFTNEKSAYDTETARKEKERDDYLAQIKAYDDNAERNSVEYSGLPPQDTYRAPPLLSTTMDDTTPNEFGVPTPPDTLERSNRGETGRSILPSATTSQVGVNSSGGNRPSGIPGAPNIGAQTQAGGAPQPGQPGGRQAMSDGALTADDIFKAQMDAIKDRTEDRKSAQERANNDALVAMGAAMMSAKGPNALAALGEGINAGTAARRVSEATSRSDFDKNLAARHAVASDLIKQQYYNGTITTKEAHTRQIALNAAMAAANAAAGRAAAGTRHKETLDATLQRTLALNTQAGHKATALEQQNLRSGYLRELGDLRKITGPSEAIQARILQLQRSADALR